MRICSTLSIERQSSKLTSKQMMAMME